jgi:hypothetical protein
VIELLLQAERALSMGMVDQAERMYRQAAGADPRNSIAVVGLARVALERADDAEALRQARRALAIDPQNVAAVRLAARLEEVMTYRGEALPAAEAPAPARPGPTAAERPGPAPTSQPPPGSTSPPAASSPASPHQTPPARRTGLDRLLRRKRP